MKNFKLSILLLLLPLSASCTNEKERVYIAYFGEHVGEKTTTEIEETHHSYLLSVKENEDEAKSCRVYSYYHHINAFAAMLTAQEASKLSGMSSVVSVFPSRSRSLQTTRSWEFAGVNIPKVRTSSDMEDLWSMSKEGDGVIIGMIDSGIWPESKSFTDEGMGSIPKSWKGKCESGREFKTSHCNKKIIGARYYYKGFEKYNEPLNETLNYRSPRDNFGHGTHTASIAAGRMVNHAASLGGFAEGTATGGAPLARLAIYKVGWITNGKTLLIDESDILAAIDDAIADGVHVLSISIGGDPNLPFSEDVIAIGALHSVRNNIIVACSAGNDGPKPATVVHAAPWIMTVGASSLDRTISSPVVLGNGHFIMGESLSPYKLENKMYPLAFAGQLASSNISKSKAGQCSPGSLSSQKAKGKIVLCLRTNGSRIGKGIEVKRAGGIGFILGNSEANGNDLASDAHFLPATTIGYNDVLKILEYINLTKDAKAKIVPAKTILHVKPAPVMTSFSSRGPNSVYRDILKPDLTAPGLNILAAWSEASSPTNMAEDNRRVKYNIMSGTSMSCPHAAGALALLKAVHGNWSSASLQSALMTSAKREDNMGNQITDYKGNPADPFQYGSGNFNPTKAADPGLVYDASHKDYLLYLCAIEKKKHISSFICPKNPPSAANLNYPSIAIPKLRGTITINRTVTNVGSCNSLYFLKLIPPPGISVKIRPCVLLFNQVGQKIRFTVTIKAQNKHKKAGNYLFGGYMWYDFLHSVWSPIAVSVA